MQLGDAEIAETFVKNVAAAARNDEYLVSLPDGVAYRIAVLGIVGAQKNRRRPEA